MISRQLQKEKIRGRPSTCSLENQFPRIPFKNPATAFVSGDGTIVMREYIFV